VHTYRLYYTLVLLVYPVDFERSIDARYTVGLLRFIDGKSESQHTSQISCLVQRVLIRPAQLQCLRIIVIY